MADIYIHTMPRSPLQITFHITNMDKFNELNELTCVRSELKSENKLLQFIGIVLKCIEVIHWK